MHYLLGLDIGHIEQGRLHWPLAWEWQHMITVLTMNNESGWIFNKFLMLWITLILLLPFRSSHWVRFQRVWPTVVIVYLWNLVGALQSLLLHEILMEICGGYFIMLSKPLQMTLSLCWANFYASSYCRVHFCFNMFWRSDVCHCLL